MGGLGRVGVRTGSGWRLTPLVLAAMWLVFAPGCASSPRPAARGGGGVHHTVHPGETVWRLSRRYGVPISTILRANGLDDVTRVPSGARLWIPGGHDRGAASLPPPPIPAHRKVAHRQGEGEIQFTWPVAGQLTSRFGSRGRGRHEGIDLSASRGTPVRAAEAGRVIYSGSGLSDYGRTVILKHLGRYSTVYAHNYRNLVRKGDFVERGQVIAEVGATGNASGTHLHFEVRRSDRPDDPLRYLPAEVRVVRNP
ncbi:MAG: LysM peptidoglycan-binding domain-containing M23 family metallopeptidase [Myxococcota bacterium]